MPTPAAGPAGDVVNACTIVTRDRIPYARVLAASFREHHRDGGFSVLVVDDRDLPRPQIEGATVLLLGDLVNWSSQLLRLALCYPPADLVGALTPWLLQSRLDAGCDHVVYLDADVLVAQRLSGIVDLLRKHSIALVPRVTEPMAVDDRTPTERDISTVGVYDRGFVAVAADENSHRMLAWWRQRVLSDGPGELLGDVFAEPTSVRPSEPWLDLVPGMFEHHIIKDATWGVAYWNVTTRSLTTSTQDVMMISGKPLTYFRFSGYSPHLPHLLTQHQGTHPRARLSESPPLRNACDDYATRLIAQGFSEALGDFRPPFGEFDGVELDPLIRRLILDELRAQDLDHGSGLNLAGGGEALRTWLLTPITSTSPLARLGRYFETLWSIRTDLHTTYPEVWTGEFSGFLDWCQLLGTVELGLARWPFEMTRKRLSSDPAFREFVTQTTLYTAHPGVEVVGYFSADLGIGQAARMLVAGIEAGGAEVSTTTYTRTSSRLGAPWTDRRAKHASSDNIAILCINADMLPTFLDRDGGGAGLAGHYKIGFWFWELDDFPEKFRPALEPLDELWVTSEFTAEVLAAVTSIPVKIMPLPVHAPVDTQVRIPELCQNDSFTFLFVFDYFSVIERKNPIGLIEAFVKAFPEPGQARLVVKTINADKRVADQERLRYAAHDRPDIVLVERYLSRDELDGLMWAADCYVSLHRSEGFGFTMAEAMSIGKPVIATAYSGNLTFMTRENSRLINYHLMSVPPGCEPYPETSRWARPALWDAARAMQKIKADPELRERLALQASRDIAARHSVDALAVSVERRLLEIREQLDQRAGVASRPSRQRVLPTPRRVARRFRPDHGSRNSGGETHE